VEKREREGGEGGERSKIMNNQLHQSDKVHIPSIGIQSGNLGSASVYHLCMAVTHMAHIVHQVQVASPLIIIKIHSL
jgi:hypothetical protein